MRLWQGICAVVAALMLALPGTALAAEPIFEKYKVPTVDGAEINVEVMRPADDPGAPVVLTYSPYNTLSETNSPNLANERLSYPLTYWNALGILATLGLLLALHSACSEREPRAFRIAGAAAAPVVGATLVLTFSRGAIAVAAIGLVSYLVLARPRGALAGLLAVVPPMVIAVTAAYQADLLARKEYATRAAVEQGRGLAWAVLLCALAAAVLRTLLLSLQSAALLVADRDDARPPSAWAGRVSRRASAGSRRSRRSRWSG